MSEHQSFQPDVKSSDEATIRELMDAEGISFDEARLQWETMKAKVNQELLENKERNNG